MKDSLSDKNKFSINWNNDNNIEYYEVISIEELRDFAIQGGFENGCDIDLIEPYIIKASSILDVGAGYGRGLENLLKKGFKGKLTSIERSVHLCEYLKSEFSPQVKIIQGDIRYVQLPEKYDLILLLWSSITEFPKDQQLWILEKLLPNLTSQGFIILDTLDHKLIPKNSVAMVNQNYIVQGHNHTAYGYIPSFAEIDVYAKELKLAVKHINYETATGRQRIIHILGKSIA